MSGQFVAGKLIREGSAVSRSIRAWFEAGGKPHHWAHARKVLRDLFPEAKQNSIEAVIRIAQGCVAVSREMDRRGENWCPPAHRVPDARRLIRDGHRGDRE